MTTPLVDLRELGGLTSAEAAEHQAAGLANTVETRGSRSVADILRSNIFTRFNAIMSVLLVVVLIFGDPRDGLFGIVMVVNAVIGIVQELRAKHTLDRLTVLATPLVGVVRDGELEDLPVNEIVLDDVVLLTSGDQVPMDGTVLTTDGLQINESLLTGEADPIDKTVDDGVMSGSFVLAGAGYVVATAVGERAYANRLAMEAKKFTLSKSEMSEAINRILQVVTWLLVPTSGLLLWSQLSAGRSLSQSMVSMVAGVVAMVPQGLVLLVSMAFAVAVIRLGKRNALIQELPAVETLARVDTICVDKTGTLTAGRIVHEQTSTLGDGDDPLDEGIAALVAAESAPNPTLQAIGDAYPTAPAWRVRSSVPFSSGRKWSSATFEDHGTWILGAPEIVLDDVPVPIIEAASAGKRVVAVVRSDEPAQDEQLPDDRRGVGYVTLVEDVRPDAAATIGYFVDQDVTPKVISGDNTLTVGAIATQVGIPDADTVIDGRSLPEPDTPEFVDVVNDHAVFGRVTPDQKRSMVGALQADYHTVAMTGDGVNDVLALKSADMGIAMGSGAPATRAVAQLVLLDNRFSSLPDVVAEGRRVIGNMERVASLFLSKTVYATLLAILIGFAGLPFPFLPRHLTLIGSITIGIPAFFLSFEPTEKPVRPGFVQRVFRFAVPAGLGAATIAFAGYGIARWDFVGAGLIEAQTVATTTMVLLGLWILFELIKPLNRGRTIMIGALFGAFAAVLALPAGRKFFELELPSARGWAVITVGVIVGALLIDVLLRLADAAVGRMAEREATRLGTTIGRRWRAFRDR